MSLLSSSSVTVSDEGSVVSVSTASSTNSRTNLPKHLLKQLLTDIKDPSFGGFEKIRSKDKEGYILSALLDEKEKAHKDLHGVELYGLRGSITRRKISKTVQHCRNYTELKYSKLLHKFDVKPCEVTAALLKDSKKATDKPKRHSRGKKALEADPDISELSEEEAPTPAKTFYKGRAFEEYRSPKPTLEESSDEELDPPALRGNTTTTRLPKMSSRPAASVEVPIGNVMLATSLLLPSIRVLSIV